MKEVIDEKERMRLRKEVISAYEEREIHVAQYIALRDMLALTTKSNQEIRNKLQYYKECYRKDREIWRRAIINQTLVVG